MAEDLRFTPIVSVRRRNGRKQAAYFPLCSLKSNFNLGSDMDGWGGGSEDGSY